MPTRRNCLVVGASGDIGRRLCVELQNRSCNVIAGLRRNVDGPWDTSLRVDLLDQDITLPEEAGISCIYHLAGKSHALSEKTQSDQEYHALNTEGTRKLLEASRRAGVGRFVFFSSVKAINEGGREVFDEDSECLPETAYGQSKLEAEKLVLHGGYVPEPVVLRLSMVYAPTQKGNLPRMIRAVAGRRFLPLPDMGNMRSMVHVDDVIRAATLAAERSEAVGKTYIITDGQFYSSRQIYELICSALGRKVPGWSVPLGLLVLLARVGDGIGMIHGRRFMFDTDALDKLRSSAMYSSEKIARELGFTPRWNLQSALSQIIAAQGLGRSR